MLPYPRVCERTIRRQVEVYPLHRPIADVVRQLLLRYQQADIHTDEVLPVKLRNEPHLPQSALIYLRLDAAVVQLADLLRREVYRGTVTLDLRIIEAYVRLIHRLRRHGLRRRGARLDCLGAVDELLHQPYLGVSVLRLRRGFQQIIRPLRRAAVLQLIVQREPHAVIALVIALFIAALLVYYAPVQLAHIGDVLLLGKGVRRHVVHAECDAADVLLRGDVALVAVEVELPCEYERRDDADAYSKPAPAGRKDVQRFLHYHLRHEVADRRPGGHQQQQRESLRQPDEVPVQAEVRVHEVGRDDRAAKAHAVFEYRAQHRNGHGVRRALHTPPPVHEQSRRHQQQARRAVRAELRQAAHRPAGGLRRTHRAASGDGDLGGSDVSPENVEKVCGVDNGRQGDQPAVAARHAVDEVAEEVAQAKLHRVHRDVQQQIHQRQHEDVPRQLPAEHREAVERDGLHRNDAQRLGEHIGLNIRPAGHDHRAQQHRYDVGDQHRHKPAQQRRHVHCLAAQRQRADHPDAAARIHVAEHRHGHRRARRYGDADALQRALQHAGVRLRVAVYVHRRKLQRESNDHRREVHRPERPEASGEIAGDARVKARYL